MKLCYQRTCKRIGRDENLLNVFRKSDKEIEGIMNELTVHAWEGEKDGKPSGNFGDSPKSYVQALSKSFHQGQGRSPSCSLPFNRRNILFIFSDAVNDSLDYSVYTLAGYPLYICWQRLCCRFWAGLQHLKGRIRPSCIRWCTPL
ncbi:hypothetical protein PO124_34010 [Bacillus licheniformis]|nr:hypothetical protein [Bacillus licheniformis]